MRMRPAFSISTLATLLALALLACPGGDADGPGAGEGEGEGDGGEGEGEGELALGAPCSEDALCGSGLCGFFGPTDERVCVVNDCPGGDGVDVCGDGTVCQDEGPCGSTCVSRGVVDDVCLSDLKRPECLTERPCADGLVCTAVPAGEGQQLGRCFEPDRFPVGTPCTSDDECDSGICSLDAADQLLCRGNDCPAGTDAECAGVGDGLVCAVLFECGSECRTPAAEGDLCGTVAEAACQLVSHACEAGLECRGTPAGDTSSCVIPAGANGRCNVDVAERDGCQDGLVCVDGVCQ